MTEKNYYSLRLLGTNAFHAKGDVLKTTNKTLNIGETAECEIRYEAGAYEPECYATIVENDEGDGWRLIRRSPHVRAQIAGMGDIGYVHQLADGDVISFEGQPMELEFHIHHDSNYGSTGIVIEQHTNKRQTYGIAAVALLAIAGMLFFWQWNVRQSDIRYEDLSEFLSSVYITRVDSIQWIEVSGDDTTQVRPTMRTDAGGAAGTAFLTTDGKLVTARHCIEYWIGDEIDLTSKVKDMSDDDIHKWAILVEKFMEEREDEEVKQQLRVFFSVYNEQMQDEPLFCFSSTDSCVHINRYHDEVLTIADFSEDYSWRTVRPYYNELEMELGDIAYIDIGIKGTIEMADSATISQLNQSSPIAALGFPGNAASKKITFAAGTISENRTDTVNRLNPDLRFDANISHGFSGGPVFVKTASHRIVAAGVVSKIDGTYKKAVPITEVEEMEKRKEEEE